jgi:hypothetical protein
VVGHARRSDDRAEAKGLQVTEEERATIIDHLNATYPIE